jgi:hypothetical protein
MRKRRKNKNSNYYYLSISYILLSGWSSGLFLKSFGLNWEAKKEYIRTFTFAIISCFSHVLQNYQNIPACYLDSGFYVWNLKNCMFVGYFYENSRFLPNFHVREVIFTQISYFYNVRYLSKGKVNILNFCIWWFSSKIIHFYNAHYLSKEE